MFYEGRYVCTHCGSVFLGGELLSSPLSTVLHCPECFSTSVAEFPYDEGLVLIESTATEITSGDDEILS